MNLHFIDTVIHGSSFIEFSIVKSLFDCFNMDKSDCTYDYWEEKGIKLGYSGETLLKFAERKQAECIAREAERIAREEKREADRIAREDRLKEREEKSREREIELEKSRIELESQRLKLNSQLASEGVYDVTAPNQNGNQGLIKMPKMPPFTDSDDITAYLIRFENLANISGWPHETWATHLALLFSGSALNVYSTLPEDVISDYSKLKAAILKAFKRTPEQYRKDFRTARINANQNYSQFLTNLYRTFDYWMGSAGIETTYEALRDFMVRDQFMFAVPLDIKHLLRKITFLIPEKWLNPLTIMHVLIILIPIKEKLKMKRFPLVFQIQSPLLISLARFQFPRE